MEDCSGDRGAVPAAAIHKEIVMDPLTLATLTGAVRSVTVVGANSGTITNTNTFN